MPAEETDQVGWDKVAAELRAARAAQQRTWGDIDNTTLGRYLSDEASNSERAEIESALQTLPELKLLTDLVRDVLADSGPAEPATPITVAVPAAASLPAPSLPFHRPAPFVQKSPWGLSRQRVAVLAAACLFLALGIGMFQSESSTPTSPPNVSRRGDAMAQAGSNSPLRVVGGQPDEDRDVKLAFARVGELQRQIEDNKTKDDSEIALAAANTYFQVAQNAQLENDRRYARKVAEGWNQVGLLYHKKGDIDRAELALTKATEINRNTLGRDDEETRQTCYRLANVYQDAVAYQGNLDPYQTRSTTAPSGIIFAVASYKAVNSREESLARFQDRVSRPETRKQIQKTVVPVLVQALEDARDPRKRAEVANALANFGPLAQDAMPVVVKFLKQAREPHELAALVRALNQMGPPTDGSVPVLVETFKRCETADVRQSIANCLATVPTGREQLNEFAAKGKDVEKKCACEALQRPRGGR